MTEQNGRPGTYALLMAVCRDTEIGVGGLGRLPFRAGHYLYIGSALGGLRARLAWHLEADKRRHWRIDYLLSQARIREIWYCVSPERQECTWARALAEMPSVAPFDAPFGASDCSCRTHLFYSRTRPDLKLFQALLPDQVQVRKIRATESGDCGFDALTTGPQ